MVVGEMAPKNLALARAEAVALRSRGRSGGS
jgi:CBS domain containing-hemolysin-like protein